MTVCRSFKRDIPLTINSCWVRPVERWHHQPQVQVQKNHRHHTRMAFTTTCSIPVVGEPYRMPRKRPWLCGRMVAAIRIGIHFEKNEERRCHLPMTSSCDHRPCQLLYHLVLLTGQHLPKNYYRFMRDILFRPAPWQNIEWRSGHPTLAVASNNIHLENTKSPTDSSSSVLRHYL